MSELQARVKTRSDGVEQTYHERGRPRSSRAARAAWGESRAELDRRMYAEQVRAVAPHITDADVDRLHGSVPAVRAARGLENGRSVDEVIEAYQEHAPRSATEGRPDLPRREVAVASPVRASTPALKKMAAIEKLRLIGRRAQ